MKALSLLALAAAAAFAPAHAQTSSVTVFGVLDAAVREVKNGDNSLTSLGSGGLNASRLGFKGVEDLSGGLRASFWLEHGFDVDTGTQTDATRFWNRRSTVSLAGNFGEIRLGRDVSPIYTGYTDFDVFGDNGVAASSKFAERLGTNVDTLTRADNLVSYFLPDMGGLYGQVSVAAGEGTDGKKLSAARLGYKTGTWNVSAAYGVTEVSPLAGNDEHKVMAFGASYDFAMATLSGYYTQDKFGPGKLDTYSLGATVPLGQGAVRAAYTKADAKGSNASGTDIEGNDAEQFAVGYLHTLSKRTSLYATYAQVKNDGLAMYAVSTSPTALAGRKSTGYEFGIRHAF